MNKKIFLLIIIFMIPIIQIIAQNKDQVTLKNGSVIRGSIVEIIPDGKITIDDAAGNTWVFNMDEVEHINQIEKQKSIFSDPYPEGWVNMTSIGFLAGSRNSMQVAPFSLITSFGYKNAMGFYTGLATGLEFLNINYIPLMVDLQYFLKNKEVTPVFIFRGGYSIPSAVNTDYYTYKGGVAASIGVGLKLRSKENFAWDVSVLYRYMQINYTEYRDWDQQDYKFTDIYNRLELRLGFYLN